MGYLEKHFESFADASPEQLVQHAVEAMNKTTGSDQNLSVKNTAVAIIDPEGKYREVSNDELQACIDKLEKKVDDPDVCMDDGPAAPAAGGDGGAAPMDTTTG